MLWRYYFHGWENHEAVRKADEGGYMAVFKGDYHFTDEDGKAQTHKASARSSALERFWWCVNHIKKISLSLGKDCEETALLLDERRVVIDSAGKRSVKTLNKYMEECRLHERAASITQPMI
jgi:hypothetical protein